MKKFLRKLYSNLLVGIIFFLLAMGFNVITFQLIYSDLEKVIYMSYVASGFSALFVMIASSIDFRVEFEEEEILDQNND